MISRFQHLPRRASDGMLLYSDEVVLKPSLPKWAGMLLFFVVMVLAGIGMLNEDKVMGFLPLV